MDSDFSIKFLWLDLNNKAGVFSFPQSFCILFLVSASALESLAWSRIISANKPQEKDFSVLTGNFHIIANLTRVEGVRKLNKAILNFSFPLFFFLVSVDFNKL